MTRKKRTAVLISGNGGNLQALIDASTQLKDYPAEIVLVISNKAEAYGLTRAQKAGIKTVTINHKDFNFREEFDTEMHKHLIANKIEIVCLAGFMRILSDQFVNKWQGRMLNIHPSLLPLFKGANGVRDALAAGAKKSGCTVHMVIPELDSGEIIVQRSIDVLPNDTEETLSQRIHAQEHIAYPEALRILAGKL